jgi:hypothetical protein
MSDETKSNGGAIFAALDCVRLEQLRLENLWLKQRIQQMSARPGRKSNRRRLITPKETEER